MKWRFWIAALWVGLSLTACQKADGGGIAAEPENPDEAVTLTLANNLPADNCTSIALEWFAAQVRERSAGRIQIEVYHDSALGDSPSCLEQLQYGGIDMVKTDVTVMANYVDDYYGLVMPYVYQDTGHFRKVHSGAIGMDLLHSARMEEQQMYGLTYYDGGARCFFGKRPIHSPEDMKGMQVRVQASRLMMSMVEALGAQPVVLEFGEVYAALQEGSVEAAENSLVNYLNGGYEAVAPYFIEDGHTRNADMLVMSQATRAKLSEEDVQLIEAAALESWQYQQTLWDQAEEDVLRRLQEQGTTIITLTEEEIARFRKACEPVWSSYEDGAYLDLIDRIVAEGRL